MARNFMKHAMLPVFFILPFINGCNLDNPFSSKEKDLLGSDEDIHGCISSAGYKWCARIEKCQRPWEIARDNDLENTSENFDFFCKS